MKICLPMLILVTVLSGLSASEASSNAYIWSRVAIGGGGYVTGIVAHPTEPNSVYFRTDNGGAYRWNQLTASWTWITTQWGVVDKNYYGIDGIALDPSHPNVVYIAAGKDVGSGG